MVYHSALKCIVSLNVPGMSQLSSALYMDIEYASKTLKVNLVQIVKSQSLSLSFLTHTHTPPHTHNMSVSSGNHLNPNTSHVTLT